MTETQNPATFLGIAKVRARYGGVSEMWVERRLRDDSGFPKPIKLGRNRFWKLADLETWETTKAVANG